MQFKSAAAGAIAALGLGLTAMPADAYIMGYNDLQGPLLFLNGATPADPTMPMSDASAQSLNTGWYASDGFHYAGNYFYGITPFNDPALGSDTTAHNSFMVFAIDNLTAPVTSATIALYQGSLPGPPYVPGASATNSFRMGSYTGLPSDFGTSVDTTIDPDTGLPFSSAADIAAAMAIFHDLGSGMAYGYQVFTPQDDNRYLYVTLNGNFLHDLNTAISAHQSSFIIGNTIGYDPDGPGPGPIPEPATWAMMILGFGATGAVLRNRRRSLAQA